jgi:hypothetical protein
MFDIPFNHAAFAMPKRARMPVTRRRASCLRDPSCRNRIRKVCLEFRAAGTPPWALPILVSLRLRASGSGSNKMQTPITVNQGLLRLVHRNRRPDQQEHSWCRGRVTLVLTHV